MYLIELVYYPAEDPIQIRLRSYVQPPQLGQGPWEQCERSSSERGSNQDLYDCPHDVAQEENYQGYSDEPFFIGIRSRFSLTVVINVRTNEAETKYLPLPLPLFLSKSLNRGLPSKEKLS